MGLMDCLNMTLRYVDELFLWCCEETDSQNGDEQEGRDRSAYGCTCMHSRQHHNNIIVNTPVGDLKFLFSIYSACMHWNGKEEGEEEEEKYGYILYKIGRWRLYLWFRKEQGYILFVLSRDCRLMQYVYLFNSPAFTNYTKGQTELFVLCS